MLKFVRKQMNRKEIERAKCRICLEQNISVRWNEVIHGYRDLTYKDCYYKYTQMEYFDEDSFSTMLCRTCANSLEFIDAFIKKAIQTHMVLQEQFFVNMNIKEDVDDIEHETNFETVLVEETEIAMNEDSNPEFITAHEEQDSCSIEERCITPLKQNHKPKDVDDIEHETNFETVLVEETEISMSEEDSNYEVITVPGEQDSCSIEEERCITPLKQTIKRKKLKPKNANESEKATDQMANDELILDDKKNTKKLDQPVCCTICSKVLTNKYSAAVHEKTHIKNRERKETCVECGMKFYCRRVLKAHMLTHLENREKAHKCEYCDKAFYNKGGLNIHRRIHLGQMISCSLCTKEFYRQVDLDKHLSSHSAARISSDIKTKSKCFVRCKYCGKILRSTGYKSHTARHMNEPLFKCSICNKEFFARKSCVKHLRIHHKKTNGDIVNFIIAYKQNRMTHLFLQQTANIQIKCE